MVKVITQETFDAVVKENVDEFGMEMAEAIKDAREQFEKQGINLGNIVISEKGSQVVVEAVQDLFKDLPDEEVLVRLKTIQDCCKDDLAQRVLATNNGAYSVLIKLVRAGADVQQANHFGGTCLINSVQSPDLVRFLIESGVDVNAGDVQHKTALHYAVQVRNRLIRDHP